MKKLFNSFFGFVLTFSFFIIWSAVAAQADVNVGINLGPPQIVESAPVEIVLMPHIGAYFVPGTVFDVFFYNGYWWSPRGERWYRSINYNGPWGTVQRGYVPAPLFKVPKDYRRVYLKERRLNYAQWQDDNRRSQNRIDLDRTIQDRNNQNRVTRNAANQQRIDKEQRDQDRNVLDQHNKQQKRQNRANQERINQEQESQNQNNQSQINENYTNQKRINKDQIKHNGKNQRPEPKVQVEM